MNEKQRPKVKSVNQSRQRPQSEGFGKKESFKLFVEFKGRKLTRRIIRVAVLPYRLWRQFHKAGAK